MKWDLMLRWCFIKIGFSPEVCVFSGSIQWQTVGHCHFSAHLVIGSLQMVSSITGNHRGSRYMKGCKELKKRMEGKRWQEESCVFPLSTMHFSLD